MLIGNIKFIGANIITINEITSDIAINIQKALNDHEDTNIPIGLSSVGKVNTDVKSEFVSQGINQTIHRVYLQIDCNVDILTPYENIGTNVSNQVLLLENLIVGEIPENYFDF